MFSLLLVLLLPACFASTTKKDRQHGVPEDVIIDDTAHHYDHEFEHNPQFEAARDGRWQEDGGGGDDHDDSPEEKEKRVKKRLKKLGSLFNVVDSNSDGIVSLDELIAWLRNSQRKWEQAHASKNLEKHDSDKDGYLSKEEYMPLFSRYASKEAEGRKIRKADVNGDGKLDSNEFTAYLFPLSHSHMRGLDALELVADIDTNKDEIVTLEEYISSFGYNRKAKGEKEEPKWMDEEKRYFRTTLDKNGDDKLDEEEIMAWMLPPQDEDDVHQIEAKEVLERSDVDGDGKLTEEEMLGNYDVFVQSHATDFRDYLQHDEL